MMATDASTVLSEVVQGLEVTGGASIASYAADARGGLGVSSRALVEAGLLDQELGPGGVEGSPSFSKIGKKRFLFLLDIVGWKRAGKRGR
jgi:hypothetical protein